MAMVCNDFTRSLNDEYDRDKKFFSLYTQPRAACSKRCEYLVYMKKCSFSQKEALQVPQTL